MLLRLVRYALVRLSSHYLLLAPNLRKRETHLQDLLNQDTLASLGSIGCKDDTWDWMNQTSRWEPGPVKAPSTRRVGSVTNTMGNFKLLNLFKPAQRIIPDVPAPQERRVPFKYVVKKHEDDVHHQIKDTKRFVTTLACLAIFLVCSQLPLYGIKASSGADPLYWARMIMASSRGTVMELGTGPIITAGLIVQLLVGSKLIDIDQSVKSDRELMKTAESTLGLLITLGQAIVYVWTGMYGPPSELGVFNCVLIVAQLFFAGLLVMLIDNMLQSGWGLGSAISLFISTNICESIMWKALSPYTFNMGSGPQFEGAMINTVQLLLTRSDKTKAMKEAFYRQGMPNMMQLLATIGVFCMVVYFQGFKVELPMRSKRARGAAMNYPIKLFYTSNMPIILQSALVSNLYFVSQLLFKRFGSNILVQLLGRWEADSMYSEQLMPVGGLVYYITPPHSLAEAAANPIHTVFYVAFMLAACALFSVTWIEVSGQSASEVAKNLREQQYFLQGHRDTVGSLKKELNRYIPTAAAFGGMCIGALTIVADFMGAIGSGTGILLAVTNIYQYWEQYERERQEMGGSVW